MIAHAVMEAAEAGEGLTVGRVCGRLGMTRQNYYAARRRRSRREIDEELVVSLTVRERKVQAFLGARKILHILRPELADHGVGIGRDRYFVLLARHGLLVVRRPAAPRTTWSRHSLPVFRNLLRGMELTGANQAWVADLTYIRTLEGFQYAALITDAWSRMIVGWHLGDTLETVGCMSSLEMALRSLPAGARPVHHSDRGCQYASHLYVGRLREAGLGVSMTEELHCYENAKAERVNGILKGEYGMGDTFRDGDQARRCLAQGIGLYNCRRPHLALGYEVPAKRHGVLV